MRDERDRASALGWVEVTPIGHVESEFLDTVPTDAWRIESRIVLRPSFAAGLDGLEPGQSLLVLYWFHRAHGFRLHQHPRGDPGRPKRGVFALRTGFESLHADTGADDVAVYLRTGATSEGESGIPLDRVNTYRARPEVALFIRRLAAQYRAACGEQLVVTSLTRPTGVVRAVASQSAASALFSSGGVSCAN